MKGRKVASMQFTTQTQQLTTCPQCDNVVRIDAEFCNICGQRLGPLSGNARPGTQLASQLASDEDEEEEYEDEEEYEYEEEEEEDESVQVENDAASQRIPPAPIEIQNLLRRLQEQSAQM